MDCKNLYFFSRVSLVVMNDPIVRSTGTGTRLCELDCQNDDEERVRITAWREYADQLAESVKKGNVREFKVFALQFFAFSWSSSLVSQRRSSGTRASHTVPFHTLFTSATAATSPLLMTTIVLPECRLLLWRTSRRTSSSCETTSSTLAFAFAVSCRSDL